MNAHALEALGLTQATAQQGLDMVVDGGLRILGAVAVLIVGRFVAGRFRNGMRRVLERADTDPTLVPFFSSMAYYLVQAIVLIAVLNLFGVETTSLIAVLGASGLAIGLALQGTLSNFASGVMLLTFRPFRIGDFVDIAGAAGTVAEIGLFSVTMDTPDNVQIIVPNSDVYGQTIRNFAANPNRRNDLVIGISYDDEIGLAIDTINRVLGADSRVLTDPEPVVAVSELGDSSVNLVVRPWCAKEDYWDLRFDLMRKLKQELETAGCSIPYPQHDVHLAATDAKD